MHKPNNAAHLIIDTNLDWSDNRYANESTSTEMTEFAGMIIPIGQDVRQTVQQANIYACR